MVNLGVRWRTKSETRKSARTLTNADGPICAKKANTRREHARANVYAHARMCAYTCTYICVYINI